ncbi:hypothetical protein BKA65DRAFT_557986 [Rhexocercosporidium sp. MPI-PUGE-AT-0058]|nr:hypothetical protein BKA65DRAFT_557986 [Rhexocercosporidium sp. MPI-PUGE-AT-0058]
MALREGVRFVDDILVDGEGMKGAIGQDYYWHMPRNSDAAFLGHNDSGEDAVWFPKDPCGTARVSKNIEEGVVVTNLKVHGIKELRVNDAAVFPVIYDCRTQKAGADMMMKSEYPNLYSDVDEKVR